MKKIVIDARESGTSTGRYVDKLIEYLYKLSPLYEIVLLAKPHREEYLRELAPDFEIVETPYKEFSFGEQIGLNKQIANMKPDLVHFTMTQQPIAYRGKTVTTIHDLTTCRFNNPSKNPVVFKFKQGVYRYVTKRVAHQSDQLITPSDFVRRDVIDFADLSDDKNITVTYESSDPIPESPTPLKYLQKQDFIMYVGRPQPHKNLWRLIEAFQMLQKKRPTLHLVLAGKKDALFSQIEQKVLEKKIKNVVFTDFVSEGELRWLYEHCQVYVFPSLSEGFGLPGLEAMRLGAPVVSSNATCLPEIYQGAAYYFDPLDVKEMAQKIADVLDDPKLRKELIQAGKMHAESFSWHRMAKQTLDIYKSALGE
jgi:glycosyltransferase involved in cell wall biosynthesis